VLLMPINGQNGCRLMSVLRLDAATACIPIVIHTEAVKDSKSGLSSQEEALPPLNYRTPNPQ